MSTPQSGPPNSENEFQTQQGQALGWEAAIEQVMEQFKLLYIPEYEEAGVRKTTIWRRGGPLVNDLPASESPNYFVGEQYLATNYSPQTIVFSRAPVTHRQGPTPKIGYHRNGYRQISTAIYTIQTRVWAFNDTDAQEIFNYLVAATWIQTLGSTGAECWENLGYAPKVESSRGTVIEFGLKIGVPIFLPPKAVGRTEAINQRTEICRPK